MWPPKRVPVTFESGSLRASLVTTKCRFSIPTSDLISTVSPFCCHNYFPFVNIFFYYKLGICCKKYT